MSPRFLLEITTGDVADALAKAGYSDSVIAIKFDILHIPNIVRPGEPWTADDVRAVLAGEGRS